MNFNLRANLAAMYGRSAAARQVGLYRLAGGPWSYLARYWTTQRFDTLPADDSARYRPLRRLLSVGMIGQVLLAVGVIIRGCMGDITGGVYIGLALLLSYPIAWSLVLFLLTLLWWLAHPKAYGKALICRLLERQVRQLRRQNEFTLIAVVGSVGKTSTKLAIARTLEAAGKRVRYQEGNYNDRLTVPLVLFNVAEPGIFNILAWLKIWSHNRKKLGQAYPYDLAVVELGIDGIGQMKQFAYLRPELTVVTAVSEEHMEFFGTLDIVAREELAVFDFSAQVLVNTDDVTSEYLGSESYDSYGLKAVDYSARLAGAPTAGGQKVTLNLRGSKLTVSTAYLGAQGAKVLLAAAAIAHMMDIDTKQLKGILAGLQPFAGRMQLLAGVEDSTLIDDTYNASPAAVKAALDVLVAMEAPQRIAILGSMNELGATGPRAHAGVGAYCDPKKIDLVVTIGHEANTHLAPAAASAGCKVKTFVSPHKAGRYVREHLKRRAVVLVKGSQNGVFAEEALKPLLADPADEQQLVRQSAYWLNIKKSQFGGR